MIKKISWGILIIVVAFLVISVFDDKKNENNASIKKDLLSLKRTFKVGVAPIPKGFSGPGTGDWIGMFSKIPEVAEIVTAQNEWRDSKEKSGQIPEILQLIQMQSKTYNYIPQFGIMFMQGEDKVILDTPNNSVNDWSNEEAKRLYKEAALNICKTYNAKYLALGIEVNTYYLNFGKEKFDKFIAAYKEMYDNIKKQCPKTKIFVTFQLEKMKGAGEKSFGKKIKPHWDLIKKFGDKLDIVAFTSYPEVEYKSPKDMPANYYSGIARYTNKTIAIAELGWTDDDGTFIRRFIELTKNMNIEFVNWIFMHDLDFKQFVPLSRTGLRKSDGTAKQSWYEWKKLKETPFKKQ